MKIFAISDLHLSFSTNKPMDMFGKAWENYLEQIEKSWNELVSDEDIVIIAGDISWAMKLNDAIVDLEYIGKLKGKKIIIKGNHDYWWSSISAVRNILPKGMYALQNDALKIGNYVFCGSRGWTNEFTEENDEKIYNREILRMELSLKQAMNLKQENDILIAIIHYPPFDFKLNDSPFTQLFEKYGVDSVIYGHLHNYDVGENLIVNKNKIKYYLTSCDMVKNNLVQIY